MKTFKLKQFVMLTKKDSNIERQIPFIDGLLIDREDEKNSWLIEIYLEKDYLSLFQKNKTEKHFLIQVKISKETNDPAYFIVKIVKLTDLDDRFNVLMTGQLIQRPREDMADLVEKLLDQGLDGEQLIERLKGLS